MRATVTTDGRRALDVEKFPWTPPTVAEVLGDAFARNDAEKTAVTLSDITKGKPYVGLYFSARWCGPCRAFTPQLAAMYERLREKNDGDGSFEVIFVSSDRSETEFETYATENMPSWLAVPFADADRRRALAEHFGVRGIPHFAVLDADLNVVNGDARAAVARDADGRRVPLAPAAGCGRGLGGDGRRHQRHPHARRAHGGGWAEVGRFDRSPTRGREENTREGAGRRLRASADALRDGDRNRRRRRRPAAPARPGWVARPRRRRWCSWTWRTGATSSTRGRWMNAP